MNRPKVRRHRAASLGKNRSKVQAYLTHEEKKLVRRAAQIAGLAESGFASKAVVREAQRILSEESLQAPEFEPVLIRGEALSTTILRDRR